MCSVELRAFTKEKKNSYIADPIQEELVNRVTDANFASRVKWGSLKMKYFLRSEKHYVSNMNGKLMTKLFHASRPDLNQTFISVSLLISLLLNLGCYLHYLCFAGKMLFQFRPFSFISHKIKFTTQRCFFVSRNFRCSSLMVFKS